MASIEERVVAMKFDGNQFLNGINQSLTALDKLNKGLKMQEGVKGFSNLGTAAQAHVGALKNIENGVQKISDRFKAMGVVGMAALSNVTNQAIFAGQTMLKSLTVGPILDGFREYETNLNSIQTILSNTQAAGTKLKDVTAALDELNHYSDQTIYNFSEMAKNIGTFTAAGVGLKPAVAAIKGIANLAALSGSNSQQASTAMYQLSQAISSGRVSLEDWNSVVNAGMGGTVFQRALAQNAEKMGTLSKGAVTLKGDMKNVTIEGKSFRESITAKPGEESWLTSEVLTRTLAQFTGDLSDAELAAQGFNAAEIKAIQAQAKMAKNAATEVKTLSQLLGTVKESVGSGWAATWKTIFGDFPEAKKLFTNVNNVLGGYVTASANARNKVLGDWKAMGGRTAIINAISNTFKALVAVVTPIKNAFREIFPATTGKQLAEFSKSIERFTKSLIVSGSTANNIKRTFAGVFAVLGIGWEIVKQIVKTLMTLFGIATEGSGGFLKTTASIGDFLVALHKAIAEGEGLSKFFSGLGKVLALPIKLIKAIAGYFGSLFKDLDSADATKAISSVTKKLEPFGKLGALVAKIWGKVIGILDNVGASFSKIGSKISTVFGGLGEQIVSAFTGLDYKDILATFNTGLFAGLVLLIKKFLGNGGGITGIFDSIGEGFENLTGALGAMQNTLRAATLLQIALAVGILAVSMNVLAKIDAAGLTRASAAITVMFTQLIGALLLFEKFSGFKGFAKMPFVAASMILLGVAINVLAIAVKQLAGLSWEDLAKGLTGVTVLLGSLIATVKLMPNPALTIASAAGLVIMAAAIKILASAVTDLSGLSWEEMAKGLIGVGVLLAGITLFSKFASANAAGILGGAGIVLLAAGIKILASAMKDLAGMSWEEIGRGLVALAGGLGIITAALAIIPPTAIVSAAAVLVVALSLGKIGDSLEQLGGMSWSEILKGLVTMFGALAIIAAGMIAMTEALPGAAALLVVALSLGKVADALVVMGAMDWEAIGKSMVVLFGSLTLISAAMIAMTEALPGAAALLVVAAALAILAPVLVTLGSMSWGEIGKGLLVLAAALAIIGVAGAVLAPVVPALIGLGAAIALLGVGAALAGVGVLALSAGLAALAITGAAGTAALVAMVSALIGLIPAAMQAIGKGLILFAEVVATSGPAITKALVTVLNSLITAIAENAPKISNQLYKMLILLVQTMNKYAGPLADAGAKLVVNILNGLARNVPKMAAAATNVVVAFINAISKNQGRVIDAGVKMIISFVNGVANAIRSNSAAMNAAGRNLGSAIIQGMVSGISGGIGAITSKAREIASSALSAAKSVLGIHSPSKEFEKVGKFVNDGFRKGLDGNKKQVTDAFNDLKDMLASLRKESSKDVDTLDAKLKKLRRTGGSKKDIAKTKASLAQAKKEEKASNLAYNELTKKLKDESSALGVLADKYDNVTSKLDAANQTLADAKKTRDDYNKSIVDQFGNAIDPTGDTKVETYIADLKKQLEDTKTFTNTIQQLRALGLNDETYKDLLSAGPSALPFMTDLLANGKAGIDEINSLNKQLDSVSSSLGQTASSALYQAAVDSAAGIVKGLQNQQAAIEKQMDKIADAMVKSIKKKLGIKSPSKVFGEVGKFSAQGLANGLDSNAGVVAKSAESMADTAIVSLRKSLSNVDKMVAGNVDLQPSIRPVLDLTDIRKNAGKISGLLPNGAKMTVMGAYNNAVDVATQVRNNGNDPGDGTDGSGGAMLAYTQNIYSPKAVSTAEIYRQTKSQLSTVKGALST